MITSEKKCVKCVCDSTDYSRWTTRGSSLVLTVSEHCSDVRRLIVSESSLTVFEAHLRGLRCAADSRGLLLAVKTSASEPGDVGSGSHSHWLLGFSLHLPIIIIIIILRIAQNKTICAVLSPQDF